MAFSAAGRLAMMAMMVALPNASAIRDHLDLTDSSLTSSEDESQTELGTAAGVLSPEEEFWALDYENEITVSLLVKDYPRERAGSGSKRTHLPLGICTLQTDIYDNLGALLVTEVTARSATWNYNSEHVDVLREGDFIVAVDGITGAPRAMRTQLDAISADKVIIKFKHGTRLKNKEKDKRLRTLCLKMVPELQPTPRPGQQGSLAFRLLPALRLRLGRRHGRGSQQAPALYSLRDGAGDSTLTRPILSRTPGSRGSSQSDEGPDLASPTGSSSSEHGDRSREHSPTRSTSISSSSDGEGSYSNSGSVDRSPHSLAPVHPDERLGSASGSGEDKVRADKEEEEEEEEITAQLKADVLRSLENAIVSLPPLATKSATNSLDRQTRQMFYRALRTKIEVCGNEGLGNHIKVRWARVLLQGEKEEEEALTEEQAYALRSLQTHIAGMPSLSDMKGLQFFISSLTTEIQNCERQGLRENSQVQWASRSLPEWAEGLSSPLRNVKHSRLHPWLSKVTAQQQDVDAET